MLGFIFAIFVGAIAGWIATKLMDTASDSLLFNIILGVIGGIIGRFIFWVLGFESSGGFISSLIMATVGAVVLIWGVRRFKKN